MPSRIDLLRAFIEKNPSDPFPRYGLAMEHKNAGRLEEAWATFEDLIRRAPDYVATYLHAGNTLVGLGRTAEARQVYEAGIEAARRKGDGHALGELQGALGELG